MWQFPNLEASLKADAQTLWFERTDPSAVAPTKAYAGDAGWDLTAVKFVKKLTGTTSLYDTCLRFKPPAGSYLEVVARSSISKSGFALANGVGVIDAHYQGSILLALTKTDPDVGDVPLPFQCAQILIRRQAEHPLREGSNLFANAPSDRGEGGFGSSTTPSAV